VRCCPIVASPTLDTDELTEAVRHPSATEPHASYVVVPATTLEDQDAASGSPGPPLQDRASALARQRLDRALDHLRELGATVDGEIGDPVALEAVRAALGRVGAQGIVVSTVPPRVSQWLRRDLPTRLRTTFPVPVTHLAPGADGRT
jgi:hypothetical protein